MVVTYVIAWSNSTGAPTSGRALASLICDCGGPPNRELCVGSHGFVIEPTIVAEVPDGVVTVIVALSPSRGNSIL